MASIQILRRGIWSVSLKIELKKLNQTGKNGHCDYHTARREKASLSKEISNYL